MFWLGPVTDINDCSPDPCVNGACTDQVNGYTCTCDPGWELTNCDQGKCILTCEPVITYDDGTDIIAILCQ